MRYTLRQIAIAINAVQPRWHIGQRGVQNMMDSACGVPVGSKVPWAKAHLDLGNIDAARHDIDRALNILKGEVLKNDA